MVGVLCKYRAKRMFPAHAGMGLIDEAGEVIFGFVQPGEVVGSVGPLRDRRLELVLQPILDGAPDTETEAPAPEASEAEVPAADLVDDHAEDPAEEPAPKKRKKQEE